MSKPIHLTIADFNIRLKSDRPILLEEGYTPFLSESETDEPDLEVECLSGIPVHLFPDSELLFEASNEAQHFYSVYRHNDGLGFLLFNQENNEVQQMGILDATFKQWTIYSEPDSARQLNPLKYPMGPILFYYLVVNNNAIMIHASGVYNGKKGRIFTGVSGVGKSTMAELWRSKGYSIINDDRMILRKWTDGTFHMYNTPMYYPDEPKSAPVHAIHLIRHFPENITQRIQGAMAVSKVMSFCIQNNFDKQYIQNYIGFIAELSSAVGVYVTGFLPDSSIVSYLEANED